MSERGPADATEPNAVAPNAVAPTAGDVAPPTALTLRARMDDDTPPPRRIRMAIPGWAGSSTAHGQGAAAQPWHCRPFVDGATYGLELVYPYRSACRVSVVDGAVRFERDADAPPVEPGTEDPFGVFAAGHYGMATGLDLLPPPGYALRLEPHPRYFTETTDDVPLAVPGHLQRFWPRKFFAVFRAPPRGAVHVFRPGEPYAQLLVVPAVQTYRVEPMEPELAADRQHQTRQLTTLTYLLSRRLWRSDRGYWFNDKYKQLLRVFRRGGMDAVRRHLQAAADRLPPTMRG